MTRSACLLVQRSDQWLVIVDDATRSLSPDARADELARNTREMLDQAGVKHGIAVLAPASTASFFTGAFSLCCDIWAQEWSGKKETEICVCQCFRTAKIRLFTKSST